MLEYHLRILTVLAWDMVNVGDWIDMWPTVVTVIGLNLGIRFDAPIAASKEVESYMESPCCCSVTLWLCLT